MPKGRINITPKRSVALFAFLSILTIGASYLLLLLLAVGCIYLPYLLLLTTQIMAVQVVLLFLGGIAVAATILWSLLPRRDKFDAPGPLLDRLTQPKLFREIDQIADALNEQVPREVYLIEQPNAFVADRGGMLGFGSRRVMGISLPLFSILNVSELRAVLAHEFAHFYSEKKHSLPLRRKQFQQLPLPSRRSAIELRPLLATKLWKLPSEKQDYGRPQSAQASSLIRANSERFAVINVSLFRIACPAIRRS